MQSRSRRAPAQITTGQASHIVNVSDDGKGLADKASSPTNERRISLILKCTNVVILGVLVVTIQHFRPQVKHVAPVKSLEVLRKELPMPAIDASLCKSLTPAERTARLKADPRGIRLNEDPVFLLTDLNHEILYIERPKILLILTLKAGTAALMTWLYRGVTGRPAWDREGCQTYVQNLSSPCWQGHAHFLYDLPLATRWDLFTKDDVMRVSLQREPYDRLISAYKSKYTCESEKFLSDTNIPFAHHLRKQARVAPGQPCMELREFAMILDRLRIYDGDKGISKVSWIESHIRPIDLRTDIIDYDVVLDSRYLIHPESVSLLFERLPFKDTIPPYVPDDHTSGEAHLDVPDDVERSLRAFANISVVSQLKNCRRS